MAGDPTGLLAVVVVVVVLVLVALVAAAVAAVVATLRIGTSSTVDDHRPIVVPLMPVAPMHFGTTATISTAVDARNNNIVVLNSSSALCLDSSFS